MLQCSRTLNALLEEYFLLETGGFSKLSFFCLSPSQSVAIAFTPEWSFEMFDIPDRRKSTIWTFEFLILSHTFEKFNMSQVRTQNVELENAKTWKEHTREIKALWMC